MMNRIHETIEQYGAKFVFDQFSGSIIFKDGKILKYAMDNQAKDVDAVLKLLDNTIKSDAHGRIFSKDGKFVGYAPEGKSIDEILVVVDMMI